ncbi:MAG: LPXTG cell wall anchor domain-containing protein [Firmicutes bacterium]|nr:LPXTG cell wall anchor domain-containing protein [Bacillota bacterium]
MILYYEFTNALAQMLFIIGIYVLLIAVSFIFAKRKEKTGLIV